MIDNGGNVEVKLHVLPETDAAGRNRVQSTLTAGGYASGSILDISLTRTATDADGLIQDQSVVTSTPSLIKLTFELPADMRGKSSYVVYRAHHYSDSRGWTVDAITPSADALKERIELRTPL